MDRRLERPRGFRDHPGPSLRRLLDLCEHLTPGPGYRPARALQDAREQRVSRGRHVSAASWSGFGGCDFITRANAETNSKHQPEAKLDRARVVDLRQGNRAEGAGCDRGLGAPKINAVGGVEQLRA